MIKTRKTVREMAMLYLILLGALIAGDQLLKYWTVTHLALGESAPLIPHIMRLTRLHNYGAAWSCLSGKTVVVGAILGAVYYLWLYEKYDKKEKPHADDADGNN